MIMQRIFPQFLPLVLATTFASALACAAPSSGTLQDEVRGLIGSMGPKKGVTAISVRDSDGQEVVNILGDQPVLPASNQKLLTTGTALRLLGADFAFQTRLLRSADRLIVIGDGDPAFGDPELMARMTYTDAQGASHEGMSVEMLLSLWSNAAKAAGITSVRELVIDDRIFDHASCHVDWPVDQLNEHYCAEVAGLNFHLNCLDFWAVPSPRGAEVTRTEPVCAFVPITNSTTPGKTKDDGLWIQRAVDANSFTVRGFLRKPLVAPVSVTISDPPMFFGNLLAERLRTQGIQVGVVRLATTADPASTGDVIGPVIRTPLKTAITRCNVDSQNLYAESLLKRIGHAATGTSGSWKNGSDAMERQIGARVGGAAGLHVVDGSGLSRENRVTTSVMTAWVSDMMHDAAVAEPYLQSMAVGGKSGTVKKRFGDLDSKLATVHCKTGYIESVCALSGVVACVNGHNLVFSVICNGFEGGGVSRAKQLQEAVVKLLARNYGKLPSRQIPADHPALGGG